MTKVTSVGSSEAVASVCAPCACSVLHLSSHFWKGMLWDPAKVPQHSCWHVNWVSAAETGVCGCTWTVITRKRGIIAGAIACFFDC